jgi:glycosidase
MLDNHDTARIADWAGRDPARIALALRLLASRTGPISILYGTEVGLASGRSPRASVDESSRIPMDWNALDVALLDRTSRILGARRANPVFAEGETIARGAAGGLFVEVKRGAGGERGLVVLNFAAEPVRSWGALGEPVAEGLEAVCGGDRLELPIPAFGGGMYLLP